MMYHFNYKDISKALCNSLKDEPFYKVLESSIGEELIECKEAMLKYFDFSMKEAQEYGELYIPENKNFGASIWCKPLNETLSKHVFCEKKGFISQHLGEISLSLTGT